MISGWRDGEIVAPMLFKGYCNANLVCKWVEESLVPELLPGQILVIDNASFHPQERIRQLVRQTGYYVCKVIGQCESLWDAVSQAFCYLS